MLKKTQWKKCPEYCNKKLTLTVFTYHENFHLFLHNTLQGIRVTSFIYTDKLIDSFPFGFHKCCFFILFYYFHAAYIGSTCIINLRFSAYKTGDTYLISYYSTFLKMCSIEIVPPSVCPSVCSLCLLYFCT
jgi:hypothetical protein